jgi:hypothetical protein
MGMASRLASRFKKGLGLALATRFDVAQGIGRSYRMLQAYERDERRTTPAVARALAAYLRDRAARLLRAANELEAEVVREEHQE